MIVKWVPGVGVPNGYPDFHHVLTIPVVEGSTQNPRDVAIDQSKKSPGCALLKKKGYICVTAWAADTQSHCLKDARGQLFAISRPEEGHNNIDVITNSTKLRPEIKATLFRGYEVA